MSIRRCIFILLLIIISIIILPRLILVNPVNAATLLFSQRISVGTTDFGSPWGKSIGDINGDGTSDFADFVLLSKMINEGAKYE